MRNKRCPECKSELLIRRISSTPSVDGKMICTNCSWIGKNSELLGEESKNDGVKLDSDGITVTKNGVVAMSITSKDGRVVYNWNPEEKKSTKKENKPEPKRVFIANVEVFALQGKDVEMYLQSVSDQLKIVSDTLNVNLLIIPTRNGIPTINIHELK